MSEQLSLFICDVMDFGFRDDQLSMENPLFILSSGRKPDTRIKVYEHNGERLEIIPSSYGQATIFDKDILLYCISHLMEAINHGNPVGRRMRIVLHDFMASTHRSVGGVAYKKVEEALIRLKGTQIKSTSIEKVIANDKGRPVIKDFKKIKAVGLVDDWEMIVDNETKKMISMEITLPEWLFIDVQNKAVLKINPKYFCLRRGLDRRLYEIGKKHVGNKSSWKVGVDLLHKKTGSAATIRKFREMLAESIRRNLLPDFLLEYDDPSKTSIQFLAVPEPPEVYVIKPRRRLRATSTATKKRSARNVYDNIPRLEDGQYKCPHCDTKCKTKGGLGAHMRVHKRENEEARNPIKGFSCPTCNKICKSKVGLGLHMKTHQKALAD